MLMATINSSIVLIALPDIFRGIHLDPLEPGNSGYLLWMLMGFLVVTAVLVVSFGRLGDMYGRVRMFNLGFAVFTVGSILLSLTWMDGSPAARWLIAMRIVQGVGGALLFANSSAILTDAFPHDERGLALGINAVVGHRRLVHRPRARRRPRPDVVAARVPRLGAGRDRSARSGRGGGSRSAASGTRRGSTGGAT